MLTGFFRHFTRKPLENIGRYWGVRFEICDFAEEFEWGVEI
jgi:hypothetical protein